MSLSIAILGASGLVGNALSAHILRSGILEPGDRLQLIGHGEIHSTGCLLAIRADLLDAFDDLRVSIEVVDDIAAAHADLVVIAAGVPMPAGFTDRRVMGRANLPLFEHIAKACGRHLPKATYIVVSNPVELAVHELAKQLPRKQIVGVGAEQDSLRFARSIARDLGVSRHDVYASVWGEHGRNMMPMWSSVRLRSQDETTQRLLGRIRRTAQAAPLQQRVCDLQRSVAHSLQSGDVAVAYKLTQLALPDARIFVEPFVTARAIHSTPNATANAVLNLIRAWKEQDGRCVRAQVQLQGELDGFHGAFGVPVSLSQDGWVLHAEAFATPIPHNDVLSSLEAIQTFLTQCLQEDTASEPYAAATAEHHSSSTEQ